MRAVLLLLALSVSATALAEVADSSANGFTVVHEVTIDAPRTETWLVAIRIGEWWSNDHTISGDASRMTIDPVPQGCFCEALGKNAGVVHLTVMSVNPTVWLRLTGGLGPLGLLGVEGNMTWDFQATDAGTRVRMTYAVGGYMASGLDGMAPAVDAVLGEALARLKAYIETGNPEIAAIG